MSFLLGQMRLHLNGHKDLTDHLAILNVKAPDLIKIPLVYGNKEYDALVKSGDRVLKGMKIALRNDHFYVPVYAPISGVVKGIEEVTSQGKCIIIENDHLEETIKAFNRIDYENATHEELVNFMKEAGIVGCGGAGFPTYIKYAKPQGIERLVINAVECEPYITADYKMISTQMDLFVIGVKTMLKMSTAKEALIGIKKTKKALIAQLIEAFKDEKNIKICKVPDVYPMGWERTLVYELIRKRYQKLPSEVGCIVSNATTAIAFADALVNQQPILQKTITISGDGVCHPQNVNCVIGTTFKDLIDACGGYAHEQITLVAGGPMMGSAQLSDENVVVTSSNAITVLKKEEKKELACLRCGRCSDYCPAGLQPVRINNAAAVNKIDAIASLRANECIECGLCTYVCPSKIEVTQGVREAKKLLASS